MPLTSTLQLTPLIDTLIVVLFFLILNFETSGEICGCGSRLRVPTAEHLDRLERAPVIAISWDVDGVVTLDGSEVAAVLDLVDDETPDPASPRSRTTRGSTGAVPLPRFARTPSPSLGSPPDWKIAKLTEQLEVKKHNWKLTNPGQPFPGDVIIQADRDVDFEVMKKVIYSAGLAGYSQLQLAANLPGGKRQ